MTNNFKKFALYTAFIPAIFLKGLYTLLINLNHAAKIFIIFFFLGHYYGWHSFYGQWNTWYWPIVIGIVLSYIFHTLASILGAIVYDFGGFLAIPYRITKQSLLAINIELGTWGARNPKLANMPTEDLLEWGKKQSPTKLQTY